VLARRVVQVVYEGHPVLSALHGVLGAKARDHQGGRPNKTKKAIPKPM